MQHDDDIGKYTYLLYKMRMIELCSEVILDVNLIFISTKKH